LKPPKGKLVTKTMSSISGKVQLCKEIKEK